MVQARSDVDAQENVLFAVSLADATYVNVSDGLPSAASQETAMLEPPLLAAVTLVGGVNLYGVPDLVAGAEAPTTFSEVTETRYTVRFVNPVIVQLV